MRFAAVLTCLVLAAAAPAGAQTPPASDVSVHTSVVIAHPPPVPDASWYEDWTETPAVGLTVGHYWTPHFKTEAEVFVTGEGRRYVNRLVRLPGESTAVSIGSEQFSRVSAVGGTAVWQFLDNQWVHPFLMGGVEVNLDRSRLHTFPQVRFSPDPRSPNGQLIAPEAFDEPKTTSRAVGVVGAGAKLYVSQRLFFRTDARVGIGQRQSGYLALRLGFGFDF